jgi:hypothetical protein
MKLENKVGSNNYYVSNSRGFNGSNLSNEAIKKAFEFSFRMCFGDGHHRTHRTGGQYGRKKGELFCNTFQGKLAEIALYNYFHSHNIEIKEPDFGVYGQGIWDDSDLEINGKKINVKSVACQSNLLLLETKDWDSNGNYIPNLKNDSTSRYDYFILARIEPDIKKQFVQKKLLYSDEITKEQLLEIVNDKIWKFDIAGYATHQDLMDTIINNQVLPQNAILNHYTKMDASNYYIQSGDLKNINTLLTTLNPILQ